MHFLRRTIRGRSVLSVDTEGSDFELLAGLDLGGAIRPLALEFESKSFTNAQQDALQHKLEGLGYRVMDANAPPDAIHWESRWQTIETMAIHTGEEAAASSRPTLVPGGLSCANFSAQYCCREETGWWRKRKRGTRCIFFEMATRSDAQCRARVAVRAALAAAGRAQTGSSCKTKSKHTLYLLLRHSLFHFSPRDQRAPPPPREPPGRTAAPHRASRQCAAGTRACRTCTFPSRRSR